MVRKQFPDKFDRMAKLSRELDVRLCRISDERRFIDEIPADWPTEIKGNFGGCGFHCGAKPEILEYDL